jgi:solute carrier family 41
MLISSGTGMALDAGVGRYRGFALLAIAMTGTPSFLSVFLFS